MDRKTTASFSLKNKSFYLNMSNLNNNIT
uniref:Uncharacterized protein n=1 Tax=Rhizophora mucronata TaxID=61149 RepID=A0A2P2PMD0_RHIMU